MSSRRKENPSPDLLLVPSVAVRLTHTQEYWAVRAIAWTMRAMPRPMALAKGAALGQLGWLTGIRRRVVLDNLAQALPDSSPRQRRRIAARAARNFGRTMAEFMRFSGHDRQRVEELVSIDGVPELTAALQEGRGAVVVTGHLGAWALYVTALSAAGVPTALLVGRQHNPKVDEFIHTIPGEAVTFISKGRSAPRGILRALKSGQSVVMVADHRSRQGIWVPYMGKEGLTLTLPGAFVARQRSALFLMAGHRVTGGRHEVTLLRLDVPSGDDRESVQREVAALCNQAIGDAVLEHPDQYFWYHRRWLGSPVDDERARLQAEREA